MVRRWAAGNKTRPTADPVIQIGWLGNIRLDIRKIRRGSPRITIWIASKKIFQSSLKQSFSRSNMPFTPMPTVTRRQPFSERYCISDSDINSLPFSSTCRLPIYPRRKPEHPDCNVVATLSISKRQTISSEARKWNCRQVEPVVAPQYGLVLQLFFSIAMGWPDLETPFPESSGIVFI